MSLSGFRLGRGCFNPRAPCGARRSQPVKMLTPYDVSIHAPRAGRDSQGGRKPAAPTRFNPRAPCGARHSNRMYPSKSASFQSTRPVRGATLPPSRNSRRSTVSIHAPRAGRDSSLSISRSIASAFQSTRPVRGATRHACAASNCACCFNPRAPCGARQLNCTHGKAGPHVSIHAPRAGRDPMSWRAVAAAVMFQSTRPVRGATRARRGRGCLEQGFQSTRPVRGATDEERSGHGANVRFNPRAPCGARRGIRAWRVRMGTRFNPRAPCGARPAHSSFDWSTVLFQSTRPVRGAT